jgi:hypothetical protein
MSHRETSDAAGNPPEIRRKIGNARGKSENGRKLRVSMPRRARNLLWSPRSRGVNRRAARLGRQRILVPFPAGLDVPGVKARDSAAHGPCRPAAGPLWKFRRHFPTPRRPPLRPPPAMSQMGHFCLMDEPGFDRANPRKPWRTSRRPLRLCGSTTLRIPRPDQPVARRVASAANPAELLVGRGGLTAKTHRTLRNRRSHSENQDPTHRARMPGPLAASSAPLRSDRRQLTVRAIGLDRGGGPSRDSRERRASPGPIRVIVA